MRKFVCLCLSLILAFQPLAQAQTLSITPLPPPGSIVKISQPTSPALLRGLVIHPEKPLSFDFIVDPGDSGLAEPDLKLASERMINYFLAALAVPQEDQWVNLSPVEADRIVPDNLLKTELGRDLLGVDYLLKQFTASLIYPEEGLGRDFWQRVYEEVSVRFPDAQIDLSTFNKVWIVPEKASVIERENIVYISDARLKVMLESDYLAGKTLDVRSKTSAADVTSNFLPLTSYQSEADALDSSDAVAKAILRDIVVPAIEKEVNEGAQFAAMRQIFHALVLAQWYQDALRDSVVNRAYSGQSKIAGIDFNDPANKEKIYEQYLEAYRQGVFNYIKEEADPSSGELIPRKYFSGGFKSQRVEREPANEAQAAEGFDKAQNQMLVKVELKDAAQVNGVRPDERWFSMDRPRELYQELKSAWSDRLGQGLIKGFLDRMNEQMTVFRRFTVERGWAPLKAVTLLSKDEESELVEHILANAPGEGPIPVLEDSVLLMNDIVRKDWLKHNAPELVGKTAFVASMEAHLWIGGLGPVIYFDLKGLSKLGMNVKALQPGYALRRDLGNTYGDPVNWADQRISNLRIIARKTIQVGDERGGAPHNVEYIVEEGVDENGVTAYFVRDVQKSLAAYQVMFVHPSRKKEDFTVAYNNAKIIVDKLVAHKHLLAETNRLTGDHPVDPNFNGLSEGFKNEIKTFISDISDEQFAKIEAALRDVLQGRGPSYYARMPYNYSERKIDGTYSDLKSNNPVTKKESQAFFNLAFADFINAQNPDMVFANDGQTGQLQATTLSHYGENEGIKNIFWAFRTHTYPRTAAGNRGEIDYHPAALDHFYGHMLGIKKKFRGLAVRLGVIDDTSEGLRTLVYSEQGHLATGVSRNHVIDMQDLDGEFVQLKGVTNGAVAEVMAKLFRKVFKSLFPNGDYERPTALQIAATKRLVKGEVNSMGLQSAIGRNVYINPDRPAVGSGRRLVTVKLSHDDAYDEANIWMMVQMGFTVVIAGNNQGTGDSIGLSEWYKKLERKIADEKTWRKDLPGDFFFVESFTGDQKKALLNALDLNIQPSKARTEANGFSEEDGTSSGGYEAAPRYGERGEGALSAQGLEAVLEWLDGKIHWKKLGQTFMPKYDTAKSWLEDVYIPFARLWEQGPEVFYKGAEMSPRLNRIQKYLITSASFLREANDAIVRTKRNKQRDAETVMRIVQTLKSDDLEGILHKGNPNVKDVYAFEVLGDGFRYANEKGLKAFIEKWIDIDNEFAGNALVHHFLRDGNKPSDFEQYLFDLFGENSVAGQYFKKWLTEIDNDPDETLMTRYVRFERLIQNLVAKIEERAVKGGDTVLAGGNQDNAMNDHLGGIDVRDINVDRSGYINELVSDEAIEQWLQNAPGVRGVIVATQPVGDLRGLLGVR